MAGACSSASQSFLNSLRLSFQVTHLTNGTANPYFPFNLSVLSILIPAVAHHTFFIAHAPLPIFLCSFWVLEFTRSVSNKRKRGALVRVSQAVAAI